MGITLNKIKIGLTRASLIEIKMFSDFKPKNVLSYMATPERTNDATLQNQNVEAYYIPQVEFAFNYLLPQEFSQIIQIFNTKGFVIEYYDSEIMMTVVRSMYMTQNELNKVLAFGGEYKAAIKSKFVMVSKFGYVDYIELKAKATQDARF